MPNHNSQAQTPRLLRSEHVNPWADRHAIYPADAAKEAFEDAISSEYAKEYWTAQLCGPSSRSAKLKEALKEALPEIDWIAKNGWKPHESVGENARLAYDCHCIAASLLTKLRPLLADTTEGDAK